MDIIENEVKTNQNKFILSEIKMYAWTASVQRNTVYKEDVNEYNKNIFRLDIINYVDSLVFPDYYVIVDEDIHINNIIKIQEKANDKFSAILDKDVHRIGTIQKHFNLYLKYLWCLNKIPMPPHCPIDKIILIKAGDRSTAWTKMETIDEYITAINKIKDKANGIPLAEWELDI